MSAVTVGACKSAPSQDPIPPVSSAAAVRAPDALEPGELAEGTARAYDLALPRGFVVQRRFSDSVAATGSAPLGSIEQYLRKRLAADRVEATATRTVFEHAHLKGGASGRWLQVEIGSRSEGVEIIVRDITPPPDIPAADETERWRRAGLGPGGKQLDPSEYQ